MVAMILFFGLYGTIFGIVGEGEPRVPYSVAHHEPAPQPPTNCYLKARYGGYDSDRAFEMCRKQHN